MNVGKVAERAVNTAEQQTPKAITARVLLQPKRSLTQMNKAPAICPTLKIEKTSPVDDAHLTQDYSMLGNSGRTLTEPVSDPSNSCI